MARKPAKPVDDAAAPPAGMKAADPASPQPPVSASTGAEQAQAGVGGAPAETMQGADGAPRNTSGGASDDAPGEVAMQMPEETAAEPPAAGDAPAANPSPDNVGIMIVQGPAKGRWRTKGRHFTPEPTIILLDDLTRDEITAIATDPELMVSIHPAV
jgi:hypothetical protein